MANVRSAYAEVQTAALTETTQEDLTKENNSYITLTVDDNGNYTAVVKLTQQTDGWTTTDADKAVAGITAGGSPTKGGQATVTYTKSSGQTAIKYE